MTVLASPTESISACFNTERARSPWRSHAWMIVMSVVVAASIASSLSYTARADREINRQYETRLAQYSEEAAQIRVGEQRKNQGAALAAQAAFDASLLDAVPRSRALAEVFNAAPAGTRLTAISLGPDTQADSDAGAAKLLDIHGIGSEMELTQFATRLGQSGWFCGVNLLPDSEIAEMPDARKFEITARFEPRGAAR